MKGRAVFDALAHLDESVIEESEGTSKRSVSPGAGRIMRTVALIAAAAAAVAVIAGHVWPSVPDTAEPKDGQSQAEPYEIRLSEATTAEVTLAEEGEVPGGAKSELKYFTEEELFSREGVIAFRGKITGLTNIKISFGRVSCYRCIAEILVSKVYKGDVKAGETVRMLVPCPVPVDDLGVWYEDSDTAVHMRPGMEGIFMPYVYGEDSVWSMGDRAVRMLDLAECGLGDGVRWAFLDTERGLVYERYSYEGADGSRDLDDIERYVVKMLG